MTTEKETYLASIQMCYPDLKIENARYHNKADGQFNVILWVNDDIVFRFPRSIDVADTFRSSLKILEYIQPHLPLPIPQPTFYNLDQSRCEQLFMGYWALSGEPLREHIIATIQNEAILDRLATQLASFLKKLHSINVEEFDLVLPVQDGRDTWIQLYDDFRAHLFEYMRPDAQKSVTATFDNFLNDPHQFEYVPSFRHGDFGPGNILYDSATQSISGIIDFDSIAVGDPALDVGAVLNLGEAFFGRMCCVYPEMVVLRKRVQFYRSTYALQEALYGLRDNVKESFEAGIVDYR